MAFAKLSTAKTFLVGPILDADGVAVTGALTATDVIIVTKNGTPGAADAQDTLTHNHTGHYVLVTDGGDFDALGKVTFSLDDTTNAMSSVSFDVITANAYDSQFSTDKLDVSLTQILGTAITETAGGRLAVGFTGVYDVAVPAFTIASVNQSANNNTILANGTYGNAKLVRSTTPANTLAIDAAGNASADMVLIIGTAPTETAGGRLAASFTTVFDVVAPVFTAESVNQTGDSYARIGAAGVSLTNLGGMSTGMKAEVNAECDTALTDYAGPTKTEMDAAHALLTTPAQVATALTNIHLQKLLAENYDPASKPGVATALLNELIGDDGGVSQFTANALELGPSGTGATPAEVETACDASLASIFLDQLLAADYDPASKPGVATALLNELIESNAGVSRYTAAALSQASGTGASVSDIVDGVFNAIYTTYVLAGSFGEWAALVLAKVNQIGTTTVTYSSPVAANGAFDIIGGDDYLAADSRAITIVVEDYSGPSLVSATGEFRIMNAFEFDTTTDTDADLVVASTIAIDGTTITMTADLTAAQTILLNPVPPRPTKNYDYRSLAITDGDGSIITLSTGTVTVNKGISPVV